MSTTTKIITALIVLVLIPAAIFFYLTRPVAAPTEFVSEEVSVLEEEVRFALVPSESVATFRIFEELNGEPVTVVGTTSALSGAVVVNPTEPAASRIETIAINARTFVTDNERRNAAIARLILKAEDPANEFITFTPTVIEGLPENPEVGAAMSFTVTGDLRIMDTTKPVTFLVTAQAESETRIVGNAATSVLRSDFSIVVPSLPFLANVADLVELELAFVMATK